MPLDATPEEYARARALVHERMLEAIWVRILMDEEESVEGAGVEGQLMLEELEEALDPVPGREAQVLRDIAIDIMEGMWRRITAELSSHFEPIPYVLPDDVGKRPEMPFRTRPFSRDDDVPDQ